MTTTNVTSGEGAVSATGGSARSQLYDLRERSWRPRPIISFLIAATSFVIPVVSAVVVVQLAAHVFRRPDSAIAIAVWLVALIALATATLWTIDRWSRRLLPLAAMLRLSLVFPDSAPHRFSLALKTGSGKALQRALASASTEAEFSTSEHAATLVVRLVSAVSAHDKLTRGHCERVRAYADLIGEELGLDAESRSKLHWAALLHDVGKLDVPAAVLNKAGKLTSDEWQVIRGHPGASDKWLEPLRGWLGKSARAASEHHERYDGDGYPNKLGGGDISLAGRIVAVADAFDVMTAARSYKKPYPAAQARVELANNAGTQFDPRIVRAFLAISLSKLRLVMGPLAWLSGLSGLFSVGSVASGAAAAVTAAAVATTGLAAPAAARTARHPVRSHVTSVAMGAGAGGPASGGRVGSGGRPGQPAPDRIGGSRPAKGAVTDTVPVTPLPDDPTPTRPDDGNNATTTTTPDQTPITRPTVRPAPVTTPGETTPAPTPVGPTPVTTPSITTPVTSPVGPTPPVAHAPVANNDTTGQLLSKSYAIDVLHNDTDVDGNLDPSTLKIVTLPASGYQSIQVVNGQIDVRVSALYTGTLVFTYEVCDTTNLCATAKVTATFALSLLG